jgi:WD40 repeat protein
MVALAIQAFGPACRAQEPKVVLPAGVAVFSVAFNPDGKRLAAGTGGGTVQLWDVRTRRWKGTIWPADELLPIEAVAFSPDGTLLAAEGKVGAFFAAEKAVVVWDLRNGKVRRFKGHTGTIFGLAFSPDGKLLAAVSSLEAKLWDVAAGKEKAVLEVNRFWVRCVAFSPGAKTLALGMARSATEREPYVLLRETATGKELACLQTGSEDVEQMAFSPDGKMLAVGSMNGVVQFWEVATSKLRRALKVDAVPARRQRFNLALAFSPDGRLLASCGDSAQSGGEVRIWEMISGKEIAILKGHRIGVGSVAFSPDGRLLVAAGGNSTVRLWDVPALLKAKQ